MEKHCVFKSVFEDNITPSEVRHISAEEYAEMRVPLDTHFLVFVQFEGD